MTRFVDTQEKLEDSQLPEPVPVPVPVHHVLLPVTGCLWGRWRRTVVCEADTPITVLIGEQQHDETRRRACARPYRHLSPPFARPLLPSQQSSPTDVRFRRRHQKANAPPRLCSTLATHSKSETLDSSTRSAAPRLSRRQARAITRPPRPRWLLGRRCESACAINPKRPAVFSM